MSYLNTIQTINNSPGSKMIEWLISQKRTLVIWATFLSLFIHTLLERHLRRWLQKIISANWTRIKKEGSIWWLKWSTTQRRMKTCVRKILRIWQRVKKMKKIWWKKTKNWDLLSLKPIDRSRNSRTKLLTSTPWFIEDKMLEEMKIKRKLK